MVFKQVFRLAFITFVWKQYKAWIVSTLILLSFIFIVGRFHSDLIQTWQINKDTSLVAKSLIYKWAAYIASVLIYCLYHTFRRKKDPKITEKSRKEQRKKIEKELSELPSSEDPFSEIRHRKKLRSRSDFLLDKNTEPTKK